MGEVKVEAGPVVVPKVPPIPDVIIGQWCTKSGVWITSPFYSAKRFADECERNGEPYRIVRIPGEEVKHGE